MRPGPGELAGGLLLVVAAVVISLPQTAVADDTDKAEQLRKDLRRMVETARDRVFPALVNIRVSTIDYWGGKEHKGASVGSGTIISTKGYVLTNQHVTNKGKKFRCTLADKQEISAEMVGEDPLTDLAVIKLDLSELDAAKSALPVASFGDSGQLQVGDQVMAMGSPFSLSRSVTLGIVSNTRRVFGGGSNGDDIEEMELEQGQRTGLFTRWIQHDALINPGNSGGPLVNLKGEVVGVNELGGSGMGFAIPSNLAKQVAAALIEHGEVPRSWIGISFKPIAKTGFDRGVLVNSVVAGSPSAEAGIEPGDLILKVNGEPSTLRFAEEIPPFMQRIADQAIGSTLLMTYERKGKAVETAIVTRRLEKDRGSETALRSWGISVAEITSKIAREMRLDDCHGVLITGIRSGGPAQLAEPPLRYGDIVREMEGETVADIAGLVDQYKRIMETDPLPEYLLVQFERRGKHEITLLKPKPEQNDDPPRDLRKAWIGIATQPILKKLATKLGHPDRLGFRITRVYPHTNAAQSDLAVGDIIIALNGETLRPKGMQDAGLLARRIRKLDAEGEATLTVLRQGQSVEISLPLEHTRYEPSEARRDENRDFELTVRDVTFFDRDANQWGEDVAGVIVVRVEDGGWADLGGIRDGDLIQKIDEYRIRSRKSFRRAMERISKEQPQRVVFKVLRGIQTRFQYVEPEWKPELQLKEPPTSQSQPASKE
jgi:serine protease Do